jgi:hypothetical protein
MRANESKKQNCHISQPLFCVFYSFYVSLLNDFNFGFVKLLIKDYFQLTLHCKIAPFDSARKSSQILLLLVFVGCSKNLPIKISEGRQIYFPCPLVVVVQQQQQNRPTNPILRSLPPYYYLPAFHLSRLGQLASPTTTKHPIGLKASSSPFLA